MTGAGKARWRGAATSGLYRHQSYIIGGPNIAREGTYAAWHAPARISSDDRVQLLSHDESPVALDQLRKELAPVQRAFEQAGAYE